MNFRYWSVLILAILAILCIVPSAAEETTIGGDQGWYVIHCNIYDAKVYIDDKYVGMTTTSTLTVPAYISGTPVKVLRIQKRGYSTFIDSIKKIPDKGGSVDLYATLNPLPDTTQTPTGVDVGWYVVHCNIEGATVLFDGTNRGEITRGLMYIPVYSTETPYKEYTVKKDGYTTFTESIANVPGKGEIIEFYATLNPVAVTTTVPEKIGGDVGWYLVQCNINNATVLFDNDVKGQIERGNLSVQVYVTGTPYRTFTVTKTGYTPYTSTIDQYPAKGETIYLYATLKTEPVVSTVPSATPAQKSPGIFWICCLALLIAGTIVSVITRK